MKNSKTKSYEELPLFLNVPILAEALGISESSAYELMRTKDFPTLRIGSRYDCLIRILRENNLPDLRFHDLRHTFATHTTASGVDAKTLSGILGHAKASFTLDVYTHVTPEMLEHASGVVEDFMTDILGKELKPWE